MYFERKHKLESYIGTDEVGRGCLAGPVTAAAVFVKKEDIGIIKGVYDSKQISKKTREVLYNQIVTTHKYAVFNISNNIIDKINIHKASLLAMKKAIKKLGIKADCIFVDGTFEIPNLNEKQKAITKGDQKFYTIAAASIVAKVERDKLMTNYKRKFSFFSFDKHKGYGTKQHKMEIEKFGSLKIHRKSFKLD